MAQATFVQDGNSIDYTPSSAVAGGQVVVQNSLVGIANGAIAANVLGSLAIQGVFDVVKATGAINSGAAIYWDDDGNPVDGHAGGGTAPAGPARPGPDECQSPNLSRRRSKRVQVRRQPPGPAD